MSVVSANSQANHRTAASMPNAYLRNWSRHVWEVVRFLRPRLAILAMGLVALPWYVAVGMRTDGEWLQGFLLKHNIGRFLEPMEGHSGPPFLYYAAVLLIGLFPWSALFPPAVAHAVRGIRSDRKQRPAIIFLVCWIALYFSFFSIARTKLPSYILPVFPACALLTAEYLCRGRWDRLMEWTYRLAFGGLFLVGLSIVIATPFVAASLLGEHKVFALVGLIPLGGGLVGLISLVIQERKGLPHIFAVTSVLFLIAVFAWAGPEVSRFQEGPLLAEVVQNRSDGAARIATYKYFSPGLVFYAGHRVDRLHATDDIPKFFEEPSAWLVTTQECLPGLKASLPNDVEIVSRYRKFLRSEEVLLLRRRQDKPTLPDKPAVIGSPDLIQRL
jgi:4-amino-4-deoxy-L-arabinose transferase-like glycosyltransferase